MPYQTPGVYRVDVFPTPPVELQTGVPAFLGFAADPRQEVVPLTLWTQFLEKLGEPLADSYLGAAVRGFFENGGTRCFVVPLDLGLPPVIALQQGLEKIAPLAEMDLICAPDVMRPGPTGILNEVDVRIMQVGLLEYCDRRGDCFAILDCLPGLNPQQVLDQRQGLGGTNGALYYPWISVQRDPVSARQFIPPCGHIAGVYARSDRRVGVHKAPANEILEGVLDLEWSLSEVEQAGLNPKSVNCLRAFPGRGIRIWGARTLSPNLDWMYINVRRLFLTAGRWIESNMAGMVFEQNDEVLWKRIERELTAYFESLFQRGALKGSKPQEAFYVRCNAETNPSEVAEEGKVVTEIGLAPALPKEFIIVRIIHGTSGVTITGPNRPL